MLDALFQRQFLVYIAGGLLCAAADFGLTLWLLQAGHEPVRAAVSGFAAGLVISYSFHAGVTFRRLSASPAVLLRFLCVVALNYGVTVACVKLALWAGAAPIAGKAFSLPLVAVNGFLLGKFWIFK